MQHLLSRLLVALLIVGLAAPVVHAHSSKEGTSPSDGAVLDSSPQIIGMSFDKPMRLTLVTLTDQTGQDYKLARQDNMQSVTRFEASPPALPPGHYTVQWRGLAEDGHPMQGTFSFEVNQSP